MKYSDNEITQGIIEIFEAINKIPRKSKHEEKISEWLLQWGKSHGFDSELDEVRNVLIRVPATKGMEDRETITFQGHMDMVCVKNSDSNHDFLKDAIEMIVDGDWLKANGTTLGADNGIALAISMYLALDKSIEHGPLELLFTVDEETGLTGAAAVKPNWLKGKYLLNLDSEDEGVFTIGCAGGEETRLYLPLNYIEPTTNFVSMKLSASGMMGGHSGVMINEQQANAIQVINRAILELDSALDIEIQQYNGGIAHNAVPSDAEVIFYISPDNIDDAKQIIAEFEAIVKREFSTSDPELNFSLQTIDAEKKVLPNEEAIKIIHLLTVFPHGIYRMSKQIEGLVETSNNLAIINTNGNEIEIISSQRSSVMSMLKVLTNKIHFLGALANAKVENRDPYNAWEPIWEAKLNEKTKESYHKLTGKDAVIEVIHAGLECGLIGSKYPEMEMISMGPSLKDVHTPKERMKISDVIKIYDFLRELLLVL